MSQQEPHVVRRPRADDRLMRDVLFGISGYPAVLVAHELKLYALLAERPHTVPEVCDALAWLNKWRKSRLESEIDEDHPR